MRRRDFLRVAACAPVLGAVAPSTVGAAPGPRASTMRGGSNYGWYRLDGCDREPFGVINGFARETALIRRQLRDMFTAGQRRLRVLVYHRRGPDSGTLMDSSGGDLSDANRRNLSGLLASVRDSGFEEVQVAFLPSGPNSPSSWTAWSDDLYAENRDVITNLRPLVVAAGIGYRLDLSNEAIPAPNQPVLLDYARRLWTDYIGRFGTTDTVGFSCIGDAARIERIPEVYGDRPPPEFDFHFYPREQADEYATFTRAHELMSAAGYRQGWTVGEAHYDDQVAADNLRRAVADTDRTVRYLLQWPLTRSRTCADVDVAPPTRFGSWSDAGF